MANNSRLQRVASLIQQELGKMFAKGLKDPRIGFITITGAKVSPDLREAWVYYTVHGSAEDRKMTAKGLEAARGFLRRELGSRMTQRVTPELHFVIDKAIDAGAHIDDLINQVHAADAERAILYGSLENERDAVVDDHAEQALDEGNAKFDGSDVDGHQEG